MDIRVMVPMDETLWQCMDSHKPLGREQLELALQRKKINETFDWFEQHFYKCDLKDYQTRCPIVIFQGPTGCGKTSTLRFISQELNIPIKEYSETSDITALNYELSKANGADDDFRCNTSLAMDRRKAQKFEHFVINSIRYQSLYPADDLNPQDEDAAAEFDSDDGFIDNYPISNGGGHFEKQPSQKPKPLPMSTGVIIHVESPLTFTRSQRVFIHSIQRILKVLRDMSYTFKRRVAIVFESLEGDGETIALPTRVKQSLKIQVFKFNPITKANMKKLVESMLKNYKNIIIERETLEQLVNDSDGDIRACLNTLHLIYNKTGSLQSVLSKINCNSSYGFDSMDQDPLLPMPVNKKQKLLHDRVKTLKLNPSLMRDTTRSFGFFHVLGKIFYQKRLYPIQDPSGSYSNKKNGRQQYSSLARPYSLENSTEHLINMIDVEPRNLIAWLHQHYYKFCHDFDVEKAALFLENLSVVDTISLSSTQSSQFFEMHNIIDQIQLYSAIESTTYSLYEDQSKVTKPSHKKVTTDNGGRIIKPSVSSSSNTSDALYSFKKPISMNLFKVKEDYQKLLDCCTIKLVEAESKSMDPINVLLDYVPYLKIMSNNWSHCSSKTQSKLTKEVTGYSVFCDDTISRLVEVIEKIDESCDLDYEATHERLQELIENEVMDPLKGSSI